MAKKNHTVLENLKDKALEKLTDFSIKYSPDTSEAVQAETFPDDFDDISKEKAEKTEKVQEEREENKEEVKEYVPVKQVQNFIPDINKQEEPPTKNHLSAVSSKENEQDDIIHYRAEVFTKKTIHLYFVLDITLSMKDAYPYLMPYLKQMVKNCENLNADIIWNLVVFRNQAENISVFKDGEKLLKELSAKQVGGGSKDGYEKGINSGMKLVLNDVLAKKQNQVSGDINDEIWCMLLLTDSLPPKEDKETTVKILNYAEELDLTLLYTFDQKEYLQNCRSEDMPQGIASFKNIVIENIGNFYTHFHTITNQLTNKIKEK